MADLLKKQITEAYTGTVERDGYTYTISANIDVSVVANLGEAGAIGADNFVEVGKRDLIDTSPFTGGLKAAASYRLEGEQYDRMRIDGRENVASKRTMPHEFGHLLGSGSHLKKAGNFMSDSRPFPKTITNTDKNLLFGPMLDAHIALGRSTGQLSGRQTRTMSRPFETTVITRAPLALPRSRIVWR